MYIHAISGDIWVKNEYSNHMKVSDYNQITKVQSTNQSMEVKLSAHCSWRASIIIKLLI